MHRSELSQVGLALSRELSELGNTFHVKSDSRDILWYESATIAAKARDLLENCGVPENLQQSTLLSDWGSSLSAEIPQLVERVREFHQHYAEIVGME